MYRLIALLVFTSLFSFSQNETKKWCFGNKAALDFMTSPPTAFTSSINAGEGCSSIADANGNLLFYTDGVTIFNANHSIMANGTGLLGSSYQSTSQGALIVKQPGSATIYYVHVSMVQKPKHINQWCNF